MSSAFSRHFRILVLALCTVGSIAADDPVELRPVIKELETTYWLDSSCKGKLEGPLKEAISMANSAASRLFDGNDAHAGSYFNRVFKMPRITSGAQIDNDAKMGGLEVLDNYQIIAGLKENRQDSRIRFYCDNDGNPGTPGARWQHTPNWQNAPRGTTLNDQRERGHDQEWQEILNGVRSDLDWLNCGYKSEHKHEDDQMAEHLAMTNGEKLLDGYPLEAQPRFITTICDFQLSEGNFATVEHLVGEWRDLSALAGGINDVEQVTSYVVLHEITHAFGSVDHAYGCHDSLLDVMGSDKAHKNADSIGDFALLCKLADMGWKLSDVEADAILGRLVLAPELRVNRASK